MALSREDLSDKEYKQFVKILQKSQEKVEKYQTPTTLFYEDDNGDYLSTGLDYPSARGKRDNFYSKDDLLFQDLFARKTNVTLDDFDNKEQFKQFMKSRRYFTSGLYDYNMAKLYTKNLKRSFDKVTNGMFEDEVDEIMDKLKSLSAKELIHLYSTNENLQIGYVYFASADDVYATLEQISAIIDIYRNVI